ncbi:MAG: hypothetical protein J7L26_07550 [Candidatus Aminicenantes bacterium]|nr:hypothetical protein [Candidatus Aminicenantes bacterium]
MEGKKGYCTRTGRICLGGAYDGGDGWGIDCLGGNPESCPYHIESNVNVLCAAYAGGWCTAFGTECPCGGDYNHKSCYLGK